MLDVRSLPANADKLKAIISVQMAHHAVEIKRYQDKILDQILRFKDQEIFLQSREVLLTEKLLYIEVLEEALRLERRKRFAAHSEKLPTGQCELFNESEVASAAPETAEAVDSESETAGTAPARNRGTPKRQALPAHLPREEVIIDLAEAEKVCEKDGSPLKSIGDDISEQLDYVPATVKVIRTIRKKYACPYCEDSIKQATLPEKILPKSNAAPGLLATIAVSKYVDALPLYRLEQMFKRLDIDLPRQTMARWMIALSEKLQPLYNLMEEDLLASDYVCCDETRVQVLNEKGKTAQSLSYMWVRSRHGPGINPIVLFDYDPTRSKEVPKRLLEGFTGYLQVDGYAGYDEVCQREGVTRLGCMAHVRRKFFEAHKAGNKPGGEANQVLQWIGKLYKIEETIQDKSIDDRKAIRLKQAISILDELKAFLDTHQNKYPPQSLMGKAIGYAHNQWVHVLTYLQDGRLSIDNNFTENRIRPFAVGRKNWLFSDSVAGAEASAMLYSILQTARGNGLEPYAYMHHLFTELPKAKTAEAIDKLLPHKIDPKRLL